MDLNLVLHLANQFKEWSEWAGTSQNDMKDIVYYFRNMVYKILLVAPEVPYPL